MAKALPKSDYRRMKETGKEKEADVSGEEESTEDINEDVDIDKLLKEEMFYFRKKPVSEFRRRAEEILKNVDLASDRRLAVVNIESGKVYRFDSILEAQDFIKERTGKWYVTTPGPLNFAEIKDSLRKDEQDHSRETTR